MEDDLILYPFHALVMGQFFFSLGGSYWGGCYLIGLAAFLIAPVMALNPTFAPLELAMVLLFGILAIGLRLRRLGSEAAAETGEDGAFDRRPPAAP